MKGIEPFHLTQDASDVLLDHRILGNTKAKQLGRGGDGKERLPELAGDAGGHLTDTLVVRLGA
jgi:hypothetical protein